MKELDQFNKILDNLTRLYPTLPAKAATLAVNFSKERFREGAWLDSTKEKWPSRANNGKGNRANRAVLVDSGALKRSIRKGRVTPVRAIISAGGYGIKYAQIHNEGGSFSGTAKVRAHQRNTFVRTRQGRREQVKGHTIRAHKRGYNIIMPQRQYLGDSYALEKRIQLMLTAEVKRVITK